ncbi:MAG: acyl-CoA dehydrogenase family protein [Myxococcales bacterium]|nr:acyl-CoA dehydrogenase family protein [Myxococcales bacterium]
MDFSLPPRVADAVGKVRKLFETDVLPLEAELLRRKSFKAILPELAAARQKVKAAGLWAPHVPVEWGGMGLSLTEHARISEELGKSPLGHYLFGCQAPDAGNMELLLAHGSPEQKDKWLKPLAAGDIRSCFSMTEPDLPGSNPTWLGTTAARDGDHYVINGRKWFTTGAEGSAFAIVMAVTNPEAPPHLRASQIIVPTDTPGFRIVRNVSVMGEPGEDWASHAEVDYENCRVPVSNLLGPENAGFFLAQERLGPGRIHHAMRWIGIAERAFDMLCRRAAERPMSPGKRLADKQIVQAWIAESRAEIDAARLYVMHTAWRIEKEGQHEARDAVSAIKFFTADVLTKVLDRAVQAHGALGLTDDTILSWLWRHERGAHIYDGADEVHKVSLAKRILGRYGVKDLDSPSGVGAPLGRVRDK